MRFVPLLLLMAAGAVWSVPAGAEVVIVEEIIAKVNGDIITRSQYEDAREDLRVRLERQEGLSPQQRRELLAKGEKHILRDLIDQRLLVQKGRELGISVEAQVLRQRDELMRRYDMERLSEFETFVSEQVGMPVEDFYEQLREQFLAQNVLGMEVGSKLYVPQEKIEAYYEQHKDEFIRKEGVHLREIFISADGENPEEVKAEAQQIQSRAAKGEPFPMLAERHSDNPQSAQAGGDIGVWRRGDLRKEIEQAVFDKGQAYVSELIEVPNGYLILKVENNYDQGLAPLEEVKEEIRQKLMQPMYQPATREYLTELRRQAYIEIRPGYVDSAAAPGKDTSWTDPAELAPVTTTKEEVLEKKKKKKLLWLIPLPGGGGGKDKDKAEEDEE